MKFKSIIMRSAVQAVLTVIIALSVGQAAAENTEAENNVWRKFSNRMPNVLVKERTRFHQQYCEIHRQNSHKNKKKHKNKGEKRKNKGSDSFVVIDNNACAVFEIMCSKDISNIVYRVDGVDSKIEDIDALQYTLVASEVTDIWVKCGNNKSGDGPGYGEHFAVDDGALCGVEPGMCVVDADCSFGQRCGEGSICSASIGGRVFIDADGNGVFTTGETGVSPALMFLQAEVASGWVDVAFRVTDASGFYNFGFLNPTFNYRIRVEAPPGEAFTFTVQDAGSDDTIDSDVSALGVSNATMPAPDAEDSTIWAGVLP